MTVTNCVFEDNGLLGVTKFGYQYRGHAGGLSVGEFNVMQTIESITRCLAMIRVRP